ncbi:MAG: hypothetical protein KGR24_03380 [Planctomycetes bacterium]|nr:hypothetical protein [Planctomycetota bacterium]
MSETAVISRAQAFLALAREQARDGLTWGEFGRLLVELLRLTVAGLDAVTGMTGPAKKAAAVGLAATLFDSLADRCVPLVAYPVWLLIRTPVRMIVLALAGGAVEALLPLTRSVQT